MPFSPSLLPAPYTRPSSAFARVAGVAELAALASLLPLCHLFSTLKPGCFFFFLMEIQFRHSHPPHRPPWSPCCVENETLTSHQESPGATWPPLLLFHSSLLTSQLRPQWSCFRAFRVFFTIPSSDRNLPSCPQILHLGPVSLLFPDKGVLLLAFWSHVEWKWPGESCCCRQEPTFSFCSFRCPLGFRASWAPLF